MAFTKNDMIEAVDSKMLMNKKRAAEVVEQLIEIIKRDMASGNDVLISSFGKFCVCEKGERRGRNPATGEPMMLRKRRVVTFKCSNILRDRVNGKAQYPMWYKGR